MDCRVPAVNADPIELGAEITLGVGRQLTGECAQVFEFGGVLGRDDETKMVVVILNMRASAPMPAPTAAKIRSRKFCE